MKYIIGKTNMPGSAEITANSINHNGYGEVYFLADVPMHKVRTFLNHLLARIKDSTYILIVVGVEHDKVAEVANIDDDAEIFQWDGK